MSESFSRENAEPGMGGVKMDPPPATEKPGNRRGRKPGTQNRATVRKNELKDDLARAHFGMSLAIVGATNAPVLGVPQAVDILEKQAEAWAVQVMAVASQDERVMRVVTSMMQAGAWVGLATATLGSVITVATLTGKVAVPYGAVVFLQPDLAKLMVQMAPPAPDVAATMNGNGDAEPTVVAE